MTKEQAPLPEADFPTPRHIALFLPSLHGGGAERVMVILANGFAARGHRVDLVLTRAEGPYLAEVAEGVRVVDLDKGRMLASLLPLVRYLRRERPDAMLSALGHANIIAVLARRLAGVGTRLVVSEHTVPRQLAGAGRWLVRQMVRVAYPRADAIVAVSNGIELEMARVFRLPAQRLRTIYNPLDIDRIQQLMLAPIDHPWLTDGSTPVVLAAGRLTAAKDYPTLLSAIALLRRKRAARLIILGHGEEEAALRSLTASLGIGDDVAFMGFQPNPFAWMHRTDLFVLSSAWEGLPGALLEAIACGANIVSTDCRAGPAEILENGHWGRLVPVGEPEALAEAIDAALSEPHPVNVAQRAEVFRTSRALHAYEQALFRADA
jgi:glycosyltransferase involved in cell wall biosynthesis